MEEQEKTTDITPDKPTKNKEISHAKNAALISVMAALLISGKYIIAFIPYNVEVVTTLIMAFAFVFSYRAVGATFIFCMADMILYPFSLDVAASYFIYWNLMAFAAALMRNLGVKWWVYYLILAICFTLSFGFLTTFFYCLIYKETNFWVKYIFGLNFYAVHLLSVLCFMCAGFIPLTKNLIKIKRSYFSR